RKRNLIKLPDGELRAMNFYGDDIGELHVIKEFRMVQQKNGDIDFFVQAERRLTEEESSTLRSFLLKIDSRLVVNIREVAVIDWGAGLKREEFVRLDI
ncbi:MAG: hypothetical protein NT163_06880, partial [Chlorobiales bacterium]|nr:hypothetical protein [Chlorobiales bacterium]